MSFEPPPPERLLSVDEIFDRADEAMLRRLSEDRRIERKPATFLGDRLGEYISMWANTSPDGGIMAMGMGDDGTFEGCEQLSAEQINLMEKSAHIHCADARMRPRRVSVRNADGKLDFVILLRVEYNRAVVAMTTKGEAFVRKGDSKCKLSGDEIRELAADKGQLSFEQMDCGLAYPDDFDAPAIRAYVANVRKSRNIPDDLADHDVLTLRRLGRVDLSKAFMPNMGCALLFAKDPCRIVPGSKIHFQRFDGEHEGTGERYNAVKDVFLEGPIPSLLAQIDSLMDGQLRTFSPLDAKGKLPPHQNLWVNSG